MITAQEMVQREVHYCVSSLVSTLAGGYAVVDHKARDLAELTEQAAELTYALEDYEEAARYEGWKTADSTPDMFVNEKMTDSETGQCESFEGTWQELCEEYEIEPYQRDVYEHWIVSDWLADRLAAKGEKVDKDFAGLTVWARTTTGQAIYIDSVIEAIHAELVAR